MGDPACASSREKYGEIRGFYGCSATLYGTTTMLGSYSAGRAPDTLPDGPAYPMEDYVAESDVQNYLVSVDPAGVLGADSKIDLSKFHPIIFDGTTAGYYAFGERVGNAFKDGAQLK